MSGEQSSSPIKVRINMEEAHSVSCELLAVLEHDQVDFALGAAACALTLGRVSTDKELSVEDETKFVQNIMEYVGLYFLEGTAN